MKEAFKYWLDCYKEGKSLIIKYLIAGITAAVVTIFANKLQLDHITYFNAILSITAFTLIISFGITCAVGIFINHNNDIESRNRNIKVGFLYITGLTSIIFVLLFVFKDFVLNTLLRIKVDNDAFYYTMIMFFFFECFVSYFQDIFKVTKKYKYQLIDFIATSFATIAGLFALYFTNNLSLTNIGFLYMSVSFCNLLILFVVVCKMYNLNIFDLSNLKITQKEQSTIIYSIALQSIWQVGYTLLSYYILRINDKTFNTYSYFDNTLDVIVGLFYTFANISLIRIETLIGKGKKEEAYALAKKTLWGILYVWITYTSIVLVLYGVVLKGLNAELVSNGKETLIMYCALNLIRFYSWGLTSYILIAGGWVKYQVKLFTGSLIYYLILFIIAPNFSNLEIYLSLFLESAVVVTLSAIMFKKKEWLTISYKDNPQSNNK